MTSILKVSDCAFSAAQLWSGTSAAALLGLRVRGADSLLTIFTAMNQTG
ncbi:MAG: hypothetical protein R3F19_32585 [Verrucomicrobiales bacterium]